MKEINYNILYLLLLVVTIVLRWEHELFNPKFWSDEMAQYIAAKSIIENKGPCLPTALASDYSSTIYLPLKQFPEGYSYLVAFVWRFTNDLFISVVIWQWIGILSYLAAWIILFKHYEHALNPWSGLAFLLITAFSLSPWLYYKPTDLLSVSFYWLGLSLSVYGQHRKGSIAIGAIAGGLFFSTVTLRYAYQPIIPATLISILGVGLFSKNKKSIVTSLATIISFAFLWIGYNWFIKVKGDLPSEAQSQKMYWGNLLQADFTIFNKSIFDDRIFHTLFQRFGGESLVNYSKIGFSMVIFGILAHYLFQKISKRELRSFHTLLIPGWITALSALGLLYLLSALSKPQDNDYLHVWTYVRETRYYAPFFVMCLFTILLIAFGKNTHDKKTTLLSYGLWIIIIASVPYYFVAKYSSIKSDPNYFSTGESKIMYGESSSDVLQVLKKAIVENTFNTTKPVYFAANRTVRYAQLSGAALPFPDFSGLIHAKTTKKVALLIHIGKNDPYNKDQLKNFINTNTLDTLYMSPSDTLFRYILFPHP